MARTGTSRRSRGQAIRDAKLSRSAAIAQLHSTIPGLNFRALVILSTSIVTPLGVHVATFVYTFTSSVDQLRQVDDSPDGDGSPLGHTLESCALVPAMIQQMKRSAPLLDIALVFAAISVQATDQMNDVRRRAILEKLGLILQGGQGVREAFCKARHGAKMAKSLAPLSRAMTGLVMAEPDLSEVEALRTAVPGAPAKANIDTLLQLHLTLASSTLTGLEDKIDEQEVKAYTASTSRRTCSLRTSCQRSSSIF